MNVLKKIGQPPRPHKHIYTKWEKQDEQPENNHGIQGKERRQKAHKVLPNPRNSARRSRLASQQ